MSTLKVNFPYGVPAMRRPLSLLLLFALLSAQVLLAAALASASPESVIKVFYFHRRFRCPECIKVENAVHKALETHFPGELKEGRVVWQVVDVSAQENQHYLTDYNFMYNTVMVVEERSGKDVRFKNLEKIYEIFEDEEATGKFIRGEVREYLGRK